MANPILFEKPFVQWNSGKRLAQKSPIARLSLKFRSWHNSHLGIYLNVLGSKKLVVIPWKNNLCLFGSERSLSEMWKRKQQAMCGIQKKTLDPFKLKTEINTELSMIFFRAPIFSYPKTRFLMPTTSSQHDVCFTPNFLKKTTSCKVLKSLSFSWRQFSSSRVSKKVGSAGEWW